MCGLSQEGAQIVKIPCSILVVTALAYLTFDLNNSKQHEAKWLLESPPGCAEKHQKFDQLTSVSLFGTGLGSHWSQKISYILMSCKFLILKDGRSCPTMPINSTAPRRFRAGYHCDMDSTSWDRCYGPSSRLRNYKIVDTSPKIRNSCQDFLFIFSSVNEFHIFVLKEFFDGG